MLSVANYKSTNISQKGELSSQRLRMDTSRDNDDDRNINNISNCINIYLEFSRALTEIKNSPTTFTLISLKKTIESGNLNKYESMIDDQVITALLNLASEYQPDPNIRQNAFFSISTIMENYPNLVQNFLEYNICNLIMNSIYDRNFYYKSSVFGVINNIITYNVPFRSIFNEYLNITDLVQCSMESFDIPNYEIIIKCFSSITQYIEINYPQADSIMWILSSAILKRLDRDPFGKCVSFSLPGIINILKNEKITLQERIEIVEAHTVTTLIQIYFKGNKSKSDKINATILASQLFILNVPNIPDVIPAILDLFQCYYLCSKYHLIVQSLQQMLIYGPEQLFGYLVYKMDLLKIMLEVHSRARIKTKLIIYGCINLVLSKIEPCILCDTILAHDKLILTMFEILETDDINVIRMVLEDIYRIVNVAISTCNIAQLFSGIDVLSAFEHTKELVNIDEDTIGLISQITTMIEKEL